MSTLSRTFADLTERQQQLYAEACPTPEDTPFFNHCMSLAKAQGLGWIEGLEFVIRCRRGTTP